MIIGFARMGIGIFWSVPAGGAVTVQRPLAMAPVLAVCGLIALLVALGVFAGTVMDGLAATADQITQPRHYIEAVLGDQRAVPSVGE